MLVFLNLELFFFGKLKMWMRIYVIVWFGDYGYFDFFLLIIGRIKKINNDLLKCYKFYINWKMLMYS